MKLLQSLQWRLSIALAVGVAIVWLVAALITGLNVRGELDEVFDDILVQTAQRILPLATHEILERDGGPGPQRVDALGENDEALTYLVRDDEGRVLLRSHDASDEVFPPFELSGFLDRNGVRFYFARDPESGFNIAVAEPLRQRSEAISESISTLLWPLLWLVLLSFLGVWALVRLSMRPVRDFQKQIEARGSGDLTAISMGKLPSEISSVARAVNKLLDRLRHALQRERSFTASSAHELRTPIAAALAQTQRLIAETSDGTAKDRAGKIENALHRLAALSEKLLQLAKSGGGGLIGKEKRDLVPVLKMVLHDFGENKHKSRLEINLPEQPVPADIDPDAFAILARNLIENALKHGAPDEPVLVELSPLGVLYVTNEGPVIPADMLERLVRPFERGETQAEGTGLGLAIAQAIAKGSETALKLSSPAPGSASGFQASIALV